MITEATSRKTELDVNAGCQPLNFEIKDVYALGLSYEEHLKEVGEKPGMPVMFKKVCQPTRSHVSEVSVPTSDAMFKAIENLDPSRAQWLRHKFNRLPCLMDYEVEVAMVLLEDVSSTELGDAHHQPRIAYALANDLTARSVQIAGEGTLDKLMFWAASKSFHGFLPMPEFMWVPAITDLEHFPEFTIETYVNDEKRQCSSTSQILYSPRKILQMALERSSNDHLSKYDMILTGTPSGIGLSVPAWKRRLAACLPSKLRILFALRANKNNPRLLRPGDSVTIHGGALGTQTTRVVRANDE